MDASDTLTFATTLSDDSPLPSWLSFDSATRTFSGTPTNDDVGTLTVKITATDTANDSVQDEFDITVANANDPPTVSNPIANQNATENTAFNFTFAANTFDDVDVGDTLTFAHAQVDDSPRPAWLNFDSATRTFNGTLTNDDVGTLAIKVITTDLGNAIGNNEFDILVANTNDPPTRSPTWATSSIFLPSKATILLYRPGSTSTPRRSLLSASRPTPMWAASRSR